YASAPAYANKTVTLQYANQKIAEHNPASAQIPKNLTSPMVLVEPDSGEVVIVSPEGYDSRGNALVHLQSYELGKNLQFVSSQKAPPQGTYIPFFRYVNGKLSTDPNPELLRACAAQDRMLAAALSGTLNTLESMNALNVAGASNKYGV